MGIVRIPVNLIYAAPGAPGVNVWHARIPDPIGSASLQAAVDIIEKFYTDLAGFFPSGVDVTGTGIAVDVDSGEETAYEPWQVDATGGAGYAPLATALCVSWRTGTAQRSGVGRTFLGPVRSGAVDTDGTPTAAILTTARLAVSNLVSSNEALQFEGGDGLVVYSRLNGSARPILSGRVRDTFAVLRSRRD